MTSDLILSHDDLPDDGPVVPPIVQTSLFTFSSVAEMRATFAGEKVRPVYSRGLNPTTRLFEKRIAALEGAEDAVATASGMAAISSAVLSVVSPGDRIVAVRKLYSDAFRPRPYG
jgi:cystathionine beta-lyase/cystathionine gamma-synthase